MRKIFSLLLLLILSFRPVNLTAQIAISSNATTPDPSAMLDVKSNNKGILIPRTSTLSRNAIINPAKGLMIFDTTTNTFWYHNGSTWNEITTGTAGNIGWALAGNSGTNPATNFIGTSDDQSLTFKVHNLPAGKLDETHANTFWGVNAGGLTVNNQNTAMGYFALRSNTLGTNNVAIGNKALYAYDGSFNTAVGDSAMANTTDLFGSSYNTALGASALTSNTWGYYNTATGAGSLFSNTTGIFNTASGFNSLHANTAGSANTANGSRALYFNTSSNNTATGADALYANTTGNNNTAQGYTSLLNNSTGSFNTATGSGAMNKNTLGSNNTVAGYEALYSNTTGTDNTAQGYASLFTNSSGSFNTATGSGAMNKSTSGINNTAAGANALGASTTGSDNVAIGFSALNSDIVGNGNIALGSKALFSHQYSYDIAIGTSALYSNTTGIHNIAVGTYAMMNNITGNNLTAVGDDALTKNTTGHDNDAFGDLSLQQNVSGNNNVAMGTNSLYINTTGDGNTALGFGTLTNNTTGTFNTALGYNANVAASSVYNVATAIGANSVAACSFCIVLGGTGPLYSQTKVGINTTTPVADLHIVQESNADGDNSRGIELQQSLGGNQWRTFIDPGSNYIFQYNNSVYGYIDPFGANYHNFSDIRLKKDIQPLDNVLNKVIQLKAVSYHYKQNNDSDPRLYGFIAQDVEKIFPDFVSTAGNGYKAIAYDNFSVVAIKAVEEEQLQIESLKSDGKELKKMMQNQIKIIEELKNEIEFLKKQKTVSSKK